MNTPELRARGAGQLQAATAQVNRLNAFLGLDGFVDEIFHIVDKRESADKYHRLTTITKYADRLAAAAGKSTNVEMVKQFTKLGGNGPIMANALASFGIKVCYLGNLGYPGLHSVFADFAKQAEVHSIAEPGYTDALEFEDGKIICGKHSALREVNWESIKTRFGQDKFTAKVQAASFVAFVNWTMLTCMNEMWSTILQDVCPKLTGPRRKLFFDLADPEKRTRADILQALSLITQFERHFDAILGLNEKEAYEIGGHLDLNTSDHSPGGLLKLATQIRDQIKVNTVVVHPVPYALAVSAGDAAIVEGPFTAKPLITTGAGDHFNAGFCLGKLLGFDNAQSVLTGVTTSGFYVRSAKSPSLADLVGLLRDWPAKA